MVMLEATKVAGCMVKVGLAGEMTTSMARHVVVGALTDTMASMATAAAEATMVMGLTELATKRVDKQAVAALVTE